MIRWTFFFDNGSVSSNVDDEENDSMLEELIHADGMIRLPGNPEAYVNMKLVKAITREEVQEQPPLAPDSSDCYIHADAQHDDGCTIMGKPLC